MGAHTLATTNPYGPGWIVAIVNGLPVYAWPGEVVTVTVNQQMK